MIEINSYEEALENIVNYTNELVDKNKKRTFEYVKVTLFDVIDSSYGIKPRLLNNDEILTYINIPNSKDHNIFESIFFIRDQILKETGKKIWGLTFTLYPDGRHEIEYDYKIPEGFSEQGEYIGEECTNESVSGFFDNIRKIGTDEFELK